MSDYKTVGFYGHSDVAYRHPNSHIDLFESRTKLKVKNIGARQASEERILYELKKNTADIAIVFHSEPQYLFLPGSDRDVGLNKVNEHRAEYLFKHWNSDAYIKFHSKFLDKFKNPETFMQVLKIHKEFLHDQDLQMNRFTGAIMQIDHFCLTKQIPVIHVLYRYIPNWIKISSGVVDHEIARLVEQHRPQDNTPMPNRLTPMGNQLVCDRLIQLMNSLDLGVTFE